MNKDTYVKLLFREGILDDSLQNMGVPALLRGSATQYLPVSLHIPHYCQLSLHYQIISGA